MPIGKPRLTKSNKNVASVSLGDSIESLTDCYTNSVGSIVKRPGTSLFVNLGLSGKVDGLLWSETLNAMIAVSSGKVFKITFNPTVTTELIGSDTMYTDQRVVFAETVVGSAYTLFMANGGDILYTSDGITISKLVSTGSASIPSNVSHVVYFDTYLIINNVGSARFLFSYPNDPFRFDTADNYEAESFVDPISAIFARSGRVYVIGTKSVEIYYNSGQVGSPFLRRYGGLSLDSGVYSYSTIVAREDRLVFIDTQRRVIEMNDSGYNVISTSYNKELQSLNSIEEATAFNISIVGKEFYVLNFLRVKRTFVYDYESKEWYEWGYWNETLSSYSNFIGNTHCFVPSQNKNFIGSFFDGIVYEMSDSFNSDNGVSIRGRILTSDYSYDNLSTRKNCVGVKFRLLRGIGKDDDTQSVPYMKIRKADNGRDINQSNFTNVSLGAVGDTAPEVTIWKGSGGQYMTRKYEIIFPDPAPFVLVSIEEQLRTVNEEK